VVKDRDIGRSDADLIPVDPEAQEDQQPPPEPVTEAERVLQNDLEVPEADALEQAIPLRLTDDVPLTSIPIEVPEADALDQARVVPLDDEDGYEEP
jgi:hypothetical protein